MLEVVKANFNVGNILGVLGILVGYYFYVKAKISDRISYVISETTIVGVKGVEFSEQLEIIFAGIKVPRVTASKLIIWNSGNTSLGPTDFLSGSPLGIDIHGEAKILEANIVLSDKAENASTVEVNDAASAAVVFDVIRPGEGLVLRVLHSGAEDALRLSGSLKRTSQSIYKLPMLFDSRAFIGPNFPARKMFFPLFILLLTIVASAVVGIILAVAVDISQFLLKMLSSKGFTLFDIGPLVDQDWPTYAGGGGFILCTLFLLQDSYRSWRSMPSKRLVDAFNA